ncbi:MAG TPA: AI-2E family transporter [Candidatus Paceibacterota bacterium]|jgi:predicted PurR-regulated permease PerM|nr:AI-2E family transporter [Candidatus Paceibacterota bacterium]
MINRKLQLQFLLVLLVGTLILSFFIFKPFLAPLALATVFSVVLQPLYRFISRRLGNKPSIASFVTVALSILCIFIPAAFLGTQVFHEARNLYGSLAENGGGTNALVAIIQHTGYSLDSYFPGAEAASVTFSSNVDEYVKQGLSWLVNNLGTALSSASALVIDLSVFIIALYYLLKDGYKLKKAIVVLSPLEDTADERVFSKLQIAVNSVIRGNLIIALIQGCLTAIGFTIFGVPNAFLWGTVASIASLVPGMGTILVLGPAVLYLFLSDHTIAAIGLIIWGTFAVGLIDNLLGPKLMGKGMELHPLYILLSVLGGIAFFGPAGIFLGPLVLNLLFAFIEIYTFLTHQIMGVK